MKVVIQIPCLNEAETLPTTLADLPRKLPGVDQVEWLIIDDGSTDDTVNVAKKHGVDHVVSLPYNQGLARAYMAGLEASLMAGADIIVNTDADNQYKAEFIADLIQPILENKAQVVVGARPISMIKQFSLVKKLLQKLGSWVVRVASGTDIPDAPSGFRAVHKNAATQLYVFSNYTYTIETIIQAGKKNIPITWVPIGVNDEVLRPSRLISSIPKYIQRSIFTIFRILILYRPLKFFTILASAIAIPGIVVVIRFLYFFFNGQGSGHVQSLVIGGTLGAAAVMIGIGGILADSLAANRLLMEEIRSRLLRESIERKETK